MPLLPSSSSFSNETVQILNQQSNKYLSPNKYNISSQQPISNTLKQQQNQQISCLTSLLSNNVNSFEQINSIKKTTPLIINTNEITDSSSINNNNIYYMMQAPNDLILNNQQIKSHQNLKQQQQTLIINKNLDISELTNMPNNNLITSYSNDNNNNNNNTNNNDNNLSSPSSSSSSSNNSSPNNTTTKVVRDERRRANHNEGFFNFFYNLNKEIYKKI